MRLSLIVNRLSLCLWRQSEIVVNTLNQCQVRETMYPEPDEGKHATGIKRGKQCTLPAKAKRETTCHWCQMQDNMPLVPNAGQHAPAWCQTRDKQLMSNAGQHAGDANEENICNPCHVWETTNRCQAWGKRATGAKPKDICWQMPSALKDAKIGKQR